MKHSIYKFDIKGTGARLFFIDVPDSPMFYLNIYLRSGYLQVDGNKYEIPHLAEHCLFESSKKYRDSYEFKCTIESLGAKYNGFSSNNLNGYNISGPKEKWKQMSKLLFGLVFDSAIREEVFNQQKEVISNELTIYKNDYKRDISNRVDNLIVEGTISYDERIKRLTNITYEDILSYYKEFYCINNSDFVVCGDLSKIKNEVIDLFTYISSKANKGTRKKFVIKLSNKYKRQIVTRDIADKTDYGFSIRFLIEIDFDFLTYKKMLFYMYLLSRGLGSRLNHKSRELGYTYSIHSAVYLTKGYLEFELSTSLKKENILPFFNLLLNEIKEINSGNISKKELNRAKGYIYGVFSSSMRFDFDYLEYYAQRLIMDIEHLNVNKLISGFKQLGLDDILQIGPQLFRDDNYVISLFGNGASDLIKDLKVDM